MGPDIDRATSKWGWLLTELGYQPYQDWPGGRSWSLGSTYLVIPWDPPTSSSSSHPT